MHVGEYFFHYRHFHSKKQLTKTELRTEFTASVPTMSTPPALQAGSSAVMVARPCIRELVMQNTELSAKQQR
jgi:hypothetical protein